MSLTLVLIFNFAVLCIFAALREITVGDEDFPQSRKAAKETQSKDGSVVGAHEYWLDQVCLEE